MSQAIRVTTGWWRWRPGAGTGLAGKGAVQAYVDAVAYLHSHGIYGRPIAGHQEVMAAPNSKGERDVDVKAGVYFGSESRGGVGRRASCKPGDDGSRFVCY